MSGKVFAEVTSRWAARLSQGGAPEEVVRRWISLRTAVGAHQQLLQEEGIGIEVSERDRVVVNAERVGLKAPFFADELDFGGAAHEGATGSHRDGDVKISDVVAAAETARAKAKTAVDTSASAEKDVGVPS